MASTVGPGPGRDEAAARDCLTRGVAKYTGDGVERRHETLMTWAETELGLDRAYAEQVYAIAEEERLEPFFALQLCGCGIGVRELETPDQDMEDVAAAQQAPPEWVGEETVELDDVALERRLRATFRRFRSHLERAPSPAAAAQAFVAEPDVTVVGMMRTAAPESP